LPNPLPGDRAWDTSPFLRPGETPDVVLIAGYHHTHAGLAVEALRRGAWAVVEKPLCTTLAQLEALLDAMGDRPSRLFACFHRRYSRFNAMALHDLGVTRGDPVDYHCTVFEIPLPPLHWYRWPASGSRQMSNGCHWIDHFLYLNAYSPPRRWTMDAGSSGTLHACAELENGAYFTLTLTDRGSVRTGVQEHVELRANDRTVRVVDFRRYQAESTDRVLRHARARKLDAFGQMYRAIGRAIHQGAPGDSRESVEVTTSLVLELEAGLAARRTHRRGLRVHSF
ncbi:MAG TPA: Gfo/Idh/MocA family oxidoreductase, partial [Longimicrobium sp.]|nr:Gfo/Idh/MocA family oxidoreductase [Longimicrobium sp.]